MLEKLLVGFLVLSGLFLLKKKKNRLPIQQKIQGNRASLLPYIHAQAVHETNNFRSRLATEQNNLFGMKTPRLRKTTGMPDNSGFLKFNSFQDSVQDLLIWMDATGFPKTVLSSGQYVRELKSRNYFEDNYFNYLKGVNSALEDLKNKGYSNFSISNF